MKGKSKSDEIFAEFNLTAKLAARFVSVLCFRVCEGYRFVGGQRKAAAADATLRREENSGATHNYESHLTPLPFLSAISAGSVLLRKVDGMKQRYIVP